MPKRQRHISQQQLQLGVQYVQQQHLSIRKAAQLANVSKSSLHRKIMELNKQQSINQVNSSVMSGDTPNISCNKQSDDSSDYSFIYDLQDLSTDYLSVIDF